MARAEYIHVGDRFLFREGRTKVRRAALGHQEHARLTRFPRRHSASSRVSCRTTARMQTVLTLERVDEPLPCPFPRVVVSLYPLVPACCFTGRTRKPVAIALSHSPVLPLTVLERVLVSPGSSSSLSFVPLARAQTGAGPAASMSAVSNAQASKPFLSAADDLITYAPLPARHST